jgi:hypothetical protein
MFDFRYLLPKLLLRRAQRFSWRSALIFRNCLYLLSSGKDRDRDKDKDKRKRRKPRPTREGGVA